MAHGWRHRVAGGCLRLAVLASMGALSASAVAAATPGGGAVTRAAVTRATAPPATATPGTASAGAAAAGALARASARAATLSTALAGLRTRAEVLTERYNQETVLEQQDAAAFQATAARLGAARAAGLRDSTLLAHQAAADYEADGGPSAAASMVAAAADPAGYLGALGVQQVMDGQRVDLVAASQAAEVVTRLFEKQAAALLQRQRADTQAARFLKLAVAAAVSRQVSAVRAAGASRARLSAALAGTRAGRTTPSGVTAAVLAGGPSGASPGVVAPDWSPDAGASAAQGDIAAAWALTQLGKPYRWGAAGPASYDCSGLALEAWAGAGVALPHWTGFQWVSGPHVPLRQLRRGDLVFYATNIGDPATIHHVGIYIGGGKMVDAPYTGAFVRIESIYAFSGLIGATRPA